MHQNSLPGAYDIQQWIVFYFSWEMAVVPSQALVMSSLECWLSRGHRRSQSSRHMHVLLKTFLTVLWVIAETQPVSRQFCFTAHFLFQLVIPHRTLAGPNNTAEHLFEKEKLFFKKSLTIVLMTYSFPLDPIRLNTDAHTAPSFHFLLLTSAFVLLRTLLTAQRCSRLARLSLPEDSGGVLAGAQPQPRRSFVVAGTEWLGHAGAPSGQAQPPAVTGASQLPPPPGAGAQGRSPRSWDVLSAFCLPHGRGRGGSTAGVWHRENDVRFWHLLVLCEI